MQKYYKIYAYEKGKLIAICKGEKYEVSLKKEDRIIISIYSKSFVDIGLNELFPTFDLTSFIVCDKYELEETTI